MNISWHNRPTSAFTLIELLVVIAVVVLIALLLLAAVGAGTAKQRHRIGCVSRLKNIGLERQRGLRHPQTTPIGQHRAAGAGVLLSQGKRFARQ